ncbi:MAG: hypothetical protein HYT79_09945 [Elusimicrobia bacterium]|nr:hypothetical protein [Elusimicrobiota bacterium]
MGLFVGPIFVMTQVVESLQSAVRSPHSAWGIQVGYSFIKDEPALDIESGGSVTAPGGASYFSGSPGSLNLETRSEGVGLRLQFPKGDYLSWDADVGSANYQIFIPSGSVTNQLATSSGYRLGVGLNVDIVRKTMVTPRVWARASWSTVRTKPQRIYFGGPGQWESVDDRWDLTRYGLLLGAESSWFGGRVSPAAGFEIFEKRAKLVDRRDGETVSGNEMGYLLFAGGAWAFSLSNVLRLELAAGKEESARLAFEQRF